MRGLLDEGRASLRALAALCGIEAGRLGRKGCLGSVYSTRDDGSAVGLTVKKRGARCRMHVEGGDPCGR